MPSSFEAFSQRYSTFYRTLCTSRGITYRYLSVPGSTGVTLVWLHGFPSSVYEWHYQLDHFRAKGYAQIAPDMLGYGGTDKPEDPAMYKRSVLAGEIVEIVDKEAPAGPVVAIAHDHGVNVLSRLADLYSDRFAAFAFLSIGYLAPQPDVPYKLEELLPLVERRWGKPIFAYWELFTKPGAPKIMKDNFDSFLDMFFAKDSVSVGTNILTVRGKTEEWIEGGKRGERGSFISDEDYAAIRDHVIGLGRGLTGPLNWYKVSTDGFTREDDKEVVAKLGDKLPLKLTKPVFYAGGAQDMVCNPKFMLPTFDNVALDLTVSDFDTTHWLYLEKPAKLNGELEKWLVAKIPHNK